MGAQNLNFAFKFSQNWVLTHENFSIRKSSDYFPTAKNFWAGTAPPSLLTTPLNMVWI